jgi:hypothetical protein
VLWLKVGVKTEYNFSIGKPYTFVKLIDLITLVVFDYRKYQVPKQLATIS